MYNLSYIELVPAYNFNKCREWLFENLKFTKSRSILLNGLKSTPLLLVVFFIY